MVTHVLSYSRSQKRIAPFDPYSPWTVTQISTTFGPDQFLSSSKRYPCRCMPLIIQILFILGALVSRCKRPMVLAQARAQDKGFEL